MYVEKHMPKLESVSAAIERGKRPVPFRTRKLSLSSSMVLQGGPCGRVDRRRTSFIKASTIYFVGAFFNSQTILSTAKYTIEFITVIFRHHSHLKLSANEEMCEWRNDGD